MANPEIPRSDNLWLLEQKVIGGKLTRDAIDAIKYIYLAPDVTIGSLVKTNIATGRWKYNEDENLVIDYENIVSRLSLNVKEEKALRRESLATGMVPENILKKIIRDGLGIIEKDNI